MAGRSMSGHHSAAAKSIVWLTPPHIITALGSFDIDPCAAPPPQPFVTAARMIALPEDGLEAEWRGRAWVNPPYGTAVIGRWLGRLADHGEGTALIFARTETENFVQHVWERASGLLFLAGRLHFHHPDGRRAKSNSGAPSVLCAYGQDDADRLAASGLAGHFVPLRLSRLFVAASLGREATWGEVVGGLLADGEPVRLDVLYRALERHPKARDRKHWREKVRQTLQRGPYRRVAAGTWERAA